MQDKRQEPGKGREEQERMRPGRAHPGAGQEGERTPSPEELKRRRQEEMFRERDEKRDGEL
ncbi:hypothetical protein [Streptomyces erythrochromogenes]|uniref:hypothetical protein n=1 Tax=Streptomyces erythrochromogenes TaxID=285574 RepID=UPI0002F173C7